MALQFHENLYFYMLFHDIYVCFVFSKNEGNLINKNPFNYSI